jgi:hypothetical protein
MKHILDAVYVITLEQRWFMWTPEKYVLETVENAYKKMIRQDQEWMGQVIIHYRNQQSHIYDGQHRITTWVLVLVSIAYLTDNPKLRDTILGKVSKVFNEFDTESVDGEGKNVLERIGGERLSNIRSEYECDLEMLNCIVQTGQVVLNSKSKIGEAFSSIHRFLSETMDETGRVAFYKYVCNDMFFDVMTITDWDQIPEFFNKINNIKMPLPLWLSVRTHILGDMGVTYKKRMRDIVKAVLDVSERKVIDENQILMLSMSLFHKRWIKASDVLSGKYYKFTPDNFVDWEKTVFGLVKIIEQVADHGHLFGLLHEFTTGHEIKSTLLVPLLYKWSETRDFDISPYFESLVKTILWGSLHLLTCTSKCKLTLNSKRYQTKIVGEKLGIVSKTFDNTVPWETTLVELKTFFCSEGRLTKDDFTTRWRDRFHIFSTKSHNNWCRALLRLLWYSEDAHEMIPDFTKADLEHILPQSLRNTYPEWVDRIGNMTLYMAKNGHDVRGNRSLGKLAVSEKLPMYSKSNIRMTRELASSLGDFGIQEIMRREEEMIQSIFGFIETEIYSALNTIFP